MVVFATVVLGATGSISRRTVGIWEMLVVRDGARRWGSGWSRLVLQASPARWCGFPARWSGSRGVSLVGFGELDFFNGARVWIHS